MFEAYVEERDIGKVDWADLWRRVGGVSETEWAAQQEKLKSTSHLGEIRQAMCTLAP